VNAASKNPPVTKKALFTCFLIMGLISFGGVLPFARRALVEERNWLTNEEFAEALSLGQLLPGPNVVNVSIMVGSHFQGPVGAILAFSGLMFAPMLVILLLAVLYGQYGQLPAVQHVFRGIAPAAAGLVVAVGFKMLVKQAKSWRATGVTLITFICSALLALPLLLVLAVLAPVGVLASWWEKK